jgi:hypothetical protein
MKDVLMIVMVLACVVFGYFIVDRFGRFMDAHFRDFHNPDDSDEDVSTDENEEESIERDHIKRSQYHAGFHSRRY